MLCASCEARHKGICGVLNPDQLVALSKHTTKKTVSSDQELFSADVPTKSYSNILAGVVKLTKLMADGRQQIVGLQFAPDFLGRPFKQSPGVFAEAATEVRLCSFPTKILEDMISESPELEHRLHEQALKELDEAREWMLTLGRKTASEKTASFLYMIATHIIPDKGTDGNTIRFDIPIKRADMADFLGLTIETVSRQITKLRKAGIIELENNRTVYVSNMNLLAKASEVDRD